jgi:hypothetical protein
MASDDEGGLDLFQEPADYFEPEKEATFATHRLLSGKEFPVRLVGHNPLWVRLPTFSGFEKEHGRSLRQPLPRIYVLEGFHVWYRSIYGDHTKLLCFLTPSTAITARSLTCIGPLSMERWANDISLSRGACG